MEYLQDKTDVCLSGGAAGADLEWGLCASSQGHAVIHWSFADHVSRAPAAQLVRLSERELSVADAALANAAVALDKSAPRRQPVSSLLQRNYYQVAWSDACYAVTWIVEGGGKPGGTAWATTMFAQLHPDNRNLFIFNQANCEWRQWHGGSLDWFTWDLIDSPPPPTGIWAGIGTRDLDERGRMAIRKVMGVLLEEK